MRKILKQVHPEDFDVVVLMAAAREGRLYIVENENEVSKEQVVKKVRAYVQRIRVFVTPRYCLLVDELWEEIFRCDALMEILKPKPKARKCKDFDKYGVMRIVGVLREKGIYEQRSDPQYDALFEEPCKDSPYRRYLSQGLEEHRQLVALRRIVEQFSNL